MLLDVAIVREIDIGRETENYEVTWPRAEMQPYTDCLTCLFTSESGMQKFG